MRILVVDDDEAVRGSLARTLRFDGYDIDTATDGVEALAAVRGGEPDGVVLDVRMPRLDGLETCRQLRAQGLQVPVLMLTARDSVGDRVAGLDAGADDYLVKPFALQELQARLRALLRRSGITAQVEQSSLELVFGDLRLDGRTHEVWRGDRLVRLTRTEFAILEVFLRHPRHVLSRTVLFEQVWGYDFGESSNSLHVYVGYLRRKLELGGEPRLLHTVRGVGFVLREDPL
ncbi:two-component system response regulator MprA [Motilibacter rhizosphaerae]|uniref:Two-component system response regulator MprA n=1 Tax=Motilibacter rhizosphaerae TaxID=598652 RepID=A0A4Q7NXR7_9ACTN|nr:response regulator transcription factor [Motilibacter rhizosphaerae]RZS91718.1 two-component system response regulator MprA [Motilibacter rhizosphaerae]